MLCRTNSVGIGNLTSLHCPTNWRHEFWMSADPAGFFARPLAIRHLLIVPEPCFGEHLQTGTNFSQFLPSGEEPKWLGLPLVELEVT